MEEISNVIEKHRPNVIYNFATIHASKSQMSNPYWIKVNLKSLIKTNIFFVNHILKVAKKSEFDIKVINCGSSLMYTPKEQFTFVNENTSTSPQNLYGMSKIISRNIVNKYRKQYNVNSGTAILFNHESELRNKSYLFSQIALQINSYVKGEVKHIEVADANHMGDWHAAIDTVRALRLISEQEKLDDYVIASGRPLKIIDLINSYFIDFLEVTPPNIYSTKKILNNNRRCLVGDASKINNLGWNPVENLNSIIDKLRKKYY